VFLPGPVRIGSLTANIGDVVASGAPLLSATTTHPAVLVSLDPGSVSQLRVGDRVLVTMPNNSGVGGRVSVIGRSAITPPTSDANGQGSAQPIVPVTIRLLARQTGNALDQAPVQVSITVQDDRDVLAAPISALLAQPGGGYALDVIQRHQSIHVPVTTGLFDEITGRVEVAGHGLIAGMQVEVPAQ
jgi:hypothetical protein